MTKQLNQFPPCLGLAQLNASVFHFFTGFPIAFIITYSCIVPLICLLGGLICSYFNLEAEISMTLNREIHKHTAPTLFQISSTTF